MSAVASAAAALEAAPAGPRILVTVGTDHHPFDRFITWINDWLGRRPELAPAVFVQWGAASVRPGCPGSRFLDAEHLGAQLDAADVMVCHGGPGSMADAWDRGQLPIVVPRLRRLGEVVDDHQVDFCRKLAQLGRVRLAEDAGDLAGLLDEAVRAPGRFRTSGPPADVGAAVAQLGQLIDELASRPRRRLTRSFPGPRIRRRPAADTATSARGEIRGRDLPGGPAKPQ